MGIMDRFTRGLSPEIKLGAEKQKKEKYLENKAHGIHGAGLNSISDWESLPLEKKKNILLEFFDKSATERTVENINSISDDKRLNDMFYAFVANFDLRDLLNNKEEINPELKNKIESKDILNLPNHIIEMYRFLNPKDDDIFHRSINKLKEAGLSNIADFFGKTEEDKEKILLTLGYTKTSLMPIWGKVRDKDKDFNDRYINHIGLISSWIANIPDEINRIKEHIPKYHPNMSADEIKQVQEEHEKKYLETLEKKTEEEIKPLKYETLVLQKIHKDFVRLYSEAKYYAKDPKVISKLNSSLQSEREIEAYVFTDLLLSELKKDNNMDNISNEEEEILMKLIVKNYKKFDTFLSDKKNE